MCDDFLKLWFRGLTDGLKQMEPENRADLFRQCARRCADSYPIGVYRKAFAASGGDISEFFRRLGTVEGIDTEELCPGVSWNIKYRECGCDLYTNGCITDGCLCECSRQSILYCLNSVMPKQVFSVEIREAVLRGDSECCFTVTRA